MDILLIKGLEKSFGDNKVLKGLDLSVPEHSIFGFIGRNGAGKTTTMKAVLGLLKVDGGEIYVLGERVKYGQTPTNRYIGYLPDVPQFYSFMNAREYLSFCGKCLGMPDDAIAKRCEELLSIVGLSDKSQRIKGYSRGMKQRLGIAAALIGEPKLLICDEPTSALDPAGRREILDVLLAVKEHTSVLFSTHILSDVEEICTDVAFLDNGKIVMKGTVEELKKMRGQDCFSLHTLTAEDADMVSACLTFAKREGEHVITVQGENEVSELLRFIADNSIQISSFSRREPSLEDLFMEVTTK